MLISDSFFACPPAMLGVLLDRGLRVDVAISIWVLQHCLKPADDIGNLRRALKPGGSLFVANNIYRAVPTREKGWANDGIDIRTTLSNTFALKAGELLQNPAVPSSLSGMTYWALLPRSLKVLCFLRCDILWCCSWNPS